MSASKSDIDQAVKDLIKALEGGMYNPKSPRYDLERLLSKLGIKSAHKGLEFGAALQMESLSATLSNVAFDDKGIKLWSKVKPSQP